MLNLHNPNGSLVTFHPYRGSDVKRGAGGYVRIDLPELGTVWATADRTSSAWRELVKNEPYDVSILGYGQAPTIWWSELTEEQRTGLLTTVES